VGSSETNALMKFARPDFTAIPVFPFISKTLPCSSGVIKINLLV